MSPLPNSSNSTDSHYKKTVMVMVTVSADVWVMVTVSVDVLALALGLVLVERVWETAKNHLRCRCVF